MKLAELTEALSPLLSNEAREVLSKALSHAAEYEKMVEVLRERLAKAMEREREKDSQIVALSGDNARLVSEIASMKDHPAVKEAQVRELEKRAKEIANQLFALKIQEKPEEKPEETEDEPKKKASRK